MFVSKITVYNFRNLGDQSVTLSRGPVYITGLNGNGKTNLVEAIYLLSGSRSFRTNSNSELLAWGKREASVFGTVTHKTGTEEIGVSFSPGQRAAYRNGNELASMTELIGVCPVVSFSPSDLSLVKGSPAGRRKFLDRHMVDLHPSFLHTLMAYQRALASKSALLKESGVTIDKLAPWNELLTEYGGKVVDNRRNFLQQLTERAAEFHAEFAPSDGALALKLESDCLASDGSVSLEGIRDGFERAANREIAIRSTTFGPHRDDVSITLGGVDARAYASQGQTRSIVLSLKLGVIELIEAKLGESPVVILDDVDSELDRGRSERLFKALTKGDRQIIVTGTAPPEGELLSNSTLQILRIELGVVLL